MRVSVIVCTYSIDLLPDTIACINSLVNQSLDDKEILLVMDRNEKLYQELKCLIPPSIEIIINEKPGLSQARNTGIMHAKGEILVFIDDDAVADRNYLFNLLKNYEDSSVIGAGGKILPKQKPNYPEELYWIGGFTYKGYPEKRCYVRNVLGCNMSFRRDVFAKAGFFDTKMGRIGRKLVTAEETEFSMRALHAFPDGNIVYDPMAVVYHKNHEYRQTVSYIIKRAYYEGRAKSHIRKMHEKDALSTEHSYLAYILTTSIPKRVACILAGKNAALNIKDIFLIIVVLICVGFGYKSQSML